MPTIDQVKLFNILNSLTPVQFGTSSLLPGYPTEEVNFDYTPILISQRLYQWSKSAIYKWVENDELTTYLVETLPMKAFKGGFSLVSKETDDEDPAWAGINELLQAIGYYDTFEEIFQDGYAYRTAFMKYDGVAFQVVPGHLIAEPKEDAYGEPLLFKVQTATGIVDIDPRDANVYYIHRRRRAWLKPIHNELILIYWITYSMTEAAAREGAKFVWVKTQHSDDNILAGIRTKFVGLSNRKMAVTGQDIEDITAIDTKLNATFPVYLDALYKKVANHSLVPSSILFGVSIGAVTGSQVDVGSEYEAYAAIQQEAEKYHLHFLPRLLAQLGITIDLKAVKFKWANTQRMSKREEEEVALLTAQRQAVQCGKPYKTINEVRTENKDAPIEGGDDIEVIEMEPPRFDMKEGKGADKSV